MEPEELIHLFHDPEQAEFVSRVIQEEGEKKRHDDLETDYRRWSADCMARLQRNMIEDQIETIRTQLKEGEKSGRDTTELMQQYDEYQKQLLRVRPENFLLA